MTTKILALTDALGYLVRFELLPGNRYDTIGVAPLIEGIEFGALFGDEALDSNWIGQNLDQRGGEVVISQKPAAPRNSRSTPRYTSDAISSKTSSANSQSSNVSPCAPAKPTKNDLSRSSRHKLTLNPDNP